MADTLCIYFQVHQPYRIRAFNLFDAGEDYFDQGLNQGVIRRVAQQCYLPVNRLLAGLVRRFEGRFRVAFSLTGTVVEQLERHAPESLESFQQLIEGGGVELLGETYHHSLAILRSRSEFRAQVAMHLDIMGRVFGITPRAFRNTELVYSNEIAREASRFGFEAILAEGAEQALLGRSPNRLHRPRGLEKVALLTRNYRLSDDIAFRFSDRDWDSHPLTADRFSSWVRETPGDLVNLFMDYETFGEHHPAACGIFQFLESLPAAFLQDPECSFVTPSQAAASFPLGEEVDVPRAISWGDEERDLSPWLGNRLQQEAFRVLYDLEEGVISSRDETILRDWRRLQSSDHLLYLSTKGAPAGAVHHYFSPHPTPYDAFAAYMNVLWDLKQRIRGTEPPGP